MAALDDKGRGHKVGMTQMGGEGAQWIGMAPFTEDGHYVQNLGDGTFFHSGSLAIRAAVAAGVTMTYKLLYNDAVAMTGGQTPIGKLEIPELTHWLALEGVKKVIITTPDPGEFNVADLHPIASVQHRDSLQAAQLELAATTGVTALVHHDPCAAEERRLRHRGQRPALKESVWINSRVCEGCGDCAEKATCMSLVHIPTEFGRKMSVHQGSCNLDMTCVKGECPSFVIARHGRRGRRGVTSAPTVWPAPPAHLADPTPAPWSGSTVIRMLGIGGTGVVTVSRVLQMAAHLSGLHAAGIDQLGLSQKGGPVTSDVRIANESIEGDVHASPSGVDVLLGFDLLGAASDGALGVASPNVTVAVLNMAEAPTASMLRHQNVDFPLASGLRARIGRATNAGRMIAIDAQLIAETLTGNHMSANFVLAGAAFQAGLFPIGPAAFDEAFRLNGVDVETSKVAFLWGRATVADPEFVAAALRPAEAVAPTAAPAALPSDLAPDPTWSDDLQAAVSLRSADLIAFQGHRLAKEYRQRVDHVAEEERQRTADPAFPLTDAFARGLYALMATKDEYEVARLHLLPEEQAAFATAFPGSRRVYMLKPPLLASVGLQRKIRLVRTARPAFTVLRAARKVRGTPFDVFGWTAERRAERRYRAEYLKNVDDALSHLTPATADVVQAVVDQASLVRGYSHVRQAAMDRARIETAQLFSQLHGSRSAVPEPSPAS
jgi:indolepyruvate ferredoxin oxidoreductase